MFGIIAQMLLKVNKKMKNHGLIGGDLGGNCDRMVCGSVAEWLKAHDSKSCGPKGLGGSNPLASAMSFAHEQTEGLFFSAKKRKL